MKFTGQAPAGRLLGGAGLRAGGGGGGQAGRLLAGQPKRHRHTQLGFALAGVVLQAVVTVAQLKRGWCCPPAGGSGALGVGPLALARAFTRSNRALPGQVQRGAQCDGRRRDGCAASQGSARRKCGLNGLG